MTNLDLAVYAGLAVAALFPFAGDALSYVKSLAPKRKPAQANESDATRRWADTLIVLLEDISEGNVLAGNDEEASRLARELIWQLIGGEDK